MVQVTNRSHVGSRKKEVVESRNSWAGASVDTAKSVMLSRVSQYLVFVM